MLAQTTVNRGVSVVMERRRRGRPRSGTRADLLARMKTRVTVWRASELAIILGTTKAKMLDEIRLHHALRAYPVPIGTLIEFAIAQDDAVAYIKRMDPSALE